MPRCSICPRIVIRMSEIPGGSCDGNEVSSRLANLGSLIRNLVALISSSTSRCSSSVHDGPPQGRHEGPMFCLFPP